MSSLLTPASFNSDENDNLISKKKISHNRTQKRYEKEPVNDKVSKILETLNDMSEDEGSNLADFAPPPMPTSIGSERANATKESMQNLGSFSSATQIGYMSPNLGNQPTPLDNDASYDLNNFKNNYGDNKSNEAYYKQYIPNYLVNAPNKKPENANNKPYYQQVQDTNNAPMSSNDVLLSKLNYMIHLLEEKQDERTNNVTEEVILYSFLGIFIIFIVDSFSRVGKYVR
jgi:hypothetical protein